MYKEKFWTQVSYTIKTCYQSDLFDLQNVRDNTESISNPEYQTSLIKYISGNCFYNGLLSRNQKLTDIDQKNSDNIDKLTKATPFIKHSLSLFHGFEPGILYNDNTWRKNQVITFPFHLSKTPAYFVAHRFSNHWT